MSEARLLNIGDIERYETKLHECAHNGRPFTASWGEIKSFLITIRSLMEWQGDVQEREAAVCPEDLGFDEYIRVLERKLAAAPASTVAAQQSERKRGIFDAGFARSGPASPAAQILHCSCGAACTPDEYAAHRAMGHDAPAIRDEAAQCYWCKHPDHGDKICPVPYLARGEGGLAGSYPCGCSQSTVIAATTPPSTSAHAFKPIDNNPEFCDVCGWSKDDCAANQPAPSTLVRKAAEGIVPACLSRTCFIQDCHYDHCWGCDDAKQERERVAAIIERVCFSTGGG